MRVSGWHGSSPAPRRTEERLLDFSAAARCNARNALTVQKGDPLNKQELIGKIATDAGITRTAAATAIDSLIEGITSSLKKGQRVTLVGFGTWGTSKRKARVGRNPQTGEAIKIKAKTAVRFKAGKQLDKKINK